MIEHRSDLAFGMVWPWERIDVNTDDGPSEPMVFVVCGHIIEASPTSETGIHSGRRRFLVRCFSCADLLHEGTTSVSAIVLMHIGPSGHLLRCKRSEGEGKF